MKSIFELWNLLNPVTGIELTHWDNAPGTEDDGDDGGDDPVSDEGGEDGGEDGKGKSKEGKFYTQDDIDRMVAKRNKTVKVELAKAQEAYETLLKQTNLTKDQRDEFEARLENIQAQMRTKEEQLKHEKEKASKAYQEQLKEVTEKATKYQTLYETSTIHRDIIDAAMGNEGWDGEQFIAILGPKAKMVEEVTQDGEPTGQLVPRIDWTISNEEGKTEVVRMSASEVVNLMKEEPRYKNMFKPNVSKGIGEGTSPADRMRNGKVDVRKLSAAEYMKYAETKEGRIALGLEKG